ncbi:MAG: gamma-glutamyl-gamma-aminobutyrate hydrolase family protein [Solirubrobacteraceae bacterium]
MNGALAVGETRPAIGICTGLTQARWSVWDQRAALLPFAYLTAIQRAGALALMVAPDPHLAAEPDELLHRIDGLILAGGADIDPAAYGAQRHPQTNDTVPERDRAELGLTRRALAIDMPVLGICRGMQLLNVALGGTLRQHLPDDVGHTEHRRRPGSFENSDHDVRLEAESLAALAAGETVHAVKSHHHQGVQRIGEGLVVTGRSTIDDLPEAIEAPAYRFVLGVQWHPEADEHSRVIGALVERARGHRSTRG